MLNAVPKVLFMLKEVFIGNFLKMFSLVKTGVGEKIYQQRVL